MSAWISVKERLPDFREHGFHTGRTIDVRYANGNEAKGVQYHGYGLAGWPGWEPLEFTHWKEPPK